jgi:endonuclease YncB( thermonuclease family)
MVYHAAQFEKAPRSPLQMFARFRAMLGRPQPNPPPPDYTRVRERAIPPAAPRMPEAPQAPQVPEVPTPPPPTAPVDDLADATVGTDFSFEGLDVLAKVVDVYDGDTMRLVFRRAPGAPLEQWRVRLAGCDAPEMRQPRDAPEPARAAARAAAHAAREEVCRVALHRVLRARLGGFDKYGRILARLEVEAVPGGGPVDLTFWLISRGHAVPYDGGKKG